MSDTLSTDSKPTAHRTGLDISKIFHVPVFPKLFAWHWLSVTGSFLCPKPLGNGTYWSPLNGKYQQVLTYTFFFTCPTFKLKHFSIQIYILKKTAQIHLLDCLTSLLAPGHMSIPGQEYHEYIKIPQTQCSSSTVLKQSKVSCIHTITMRRCNDDWCHKLA